MERRNNTSNSSTYWPEIYSYTGLVARYNSDERNQKTTLIRRTPEGVLVSSIGTNTKNTTDELESSIQQIKSYHRAAKHFVDEKLIDQEEIVNLKERNDILSKKNKILNEAEANSIKNYSCAMRMVTKSNLTNAILKEQKNNLMKCSAEAKAEAEVRENELMDEIEWLKNNKAEIKAELDRSETRIGELVVENERLNEKASENTIKEHDGLKEEEPFNIVGQADYSSPLVMKKRTRSSRICMSKRSEGISLNPQEATESDESAHSQKDFVDAQVSENESEWVDYEKGYLTSDTDAFGEPLSFEAVAKDRALKRARREVRLYNTKLNPSLNFFYRSKNIRENKD